ncbi:hypothetical protein AB1K18_10300 [Peribacillus simplex]|uniref:hypothetical protein n=1 Tax=Peribacillus simplex TaxID=1478 RepID=UPI003B8C4A43
MLPFKFLTMGRLYKKVWTLFLIEFPSWHYRLYRKERTASLHSVRVASALNDEITTTCMMLRLYSVGSCTIYSYCRHIERAENRKSAHDDMVDAVSGDFSS